MVRTVQFEIPSDIAGELKKLDIVDDREACVSLAEFVKRAWHVLEPGTIYSHNWHIDAICEHLEAATRGDITRLLVNVPPGSSKSLLISVMWNAWEWGPMGMSDKRWLCTSFKESLTTRDTSKVRDLIMSDWYQERWPHVHLTKKADTAIANDRRGTREGHPFGSLTSQRGDRFIVDDPHSTETAESEVDRKKTSRKFSEGAINRLNDQVRSIIAVVMQRLNEDDISGLILERYPDYVHLCLPMEFEPERRCVTKIGFVDPRTEDGEVLDPRRFPPEAIEELKISGEYFWAGQYQQRPAPRDGGMFKLAWFDNRYITEVPDGTKWKRWWDLAATDSKTADWTAGVLLGRTPQGRYIIGDSKRFRKEPHERDMLIRRQCENDVARFGAANIEFYIPKDPAAGGKSQTYHLGKMLDGFNVKAFREEGKKELRAQGFNSQCGLGNVDILTGDWNREFMDELTVFPSGKYDDQVDAVVNAYIRWVSQPMPKFALAAPKVIDMR